MVTVTVNPIAMIVSEFADEPDHHDMSAARLRNFPAVNPGFVYTRNFCRDMAPL
jgi:hypothetical protein